MNKNQPKFIPPICLGTESCCHIFDNINEAVSIYKMICNKSGEVIDLLIMYFNSKSVLKELTSLEESVDRSLSEIYKEESSHYIQIANDVVSIKEGKSFERFFESVNKYISGSAFSPDGELLVLLERDNTQEVSSKRALKESETKYRTIFENTGIAFIIIESDMTISLMNSEAEKIIGYTKGEVENKKKWTEFVADEDDLKKMKRYHMLRRINESNAPKSYEFKAITKKRDKIDIFVNVSIIPGTKRGIASFLDITRHKKNDMDLKEREEELKTLIENSPDAITRFDENLRHSFINPAGTQMTGLREEDYIGKTHAELGMPKELVEEVDNLLKSVFETGKTKTYRFELPTPEGVKYYYSYNIPEFDEKGEVKSVLAIAHDITQSKQMEDKLKAARDNLEMKVYERTAELKKSNEELKQMIEKYKSIEKSLEKSKDHYQTLVQNMPDIIVRIDRNLKSIFINHVALSLFEEITGIPKSEFIGKNFEELGLHGKTVELLKERIIEVFKTRKRVDFKFKLKTFTGVKFYHTYFIPEYDNYGNVKWVLTISRDITDFKKAELALSESEERYKQLFEASPNFTVQVGLDGLIIDANLAAQKTLNKSKEELIGTHFAELDVLFEEDVSIFVENFFLLLQVEHVEPYETRIRAQNEVRWGDTYLILLRKNNQPNAILIISHDITDRKLAEAKLKKTIEELISSNYELQQFAFITSHDLQEPLRSIASYAGLLKRRYEGRLDEDADDFIKFMIDGSKRMKEMIQGLLEYSQIGTKGGEFDEFNAEKSLKVALSNLKVSISENNASINYESLPTIYADPDQITRLFQNLISNSIKFRKLDEPPEIHISAKKGENEWIFSVSDNSIGMEQEYTDRIFEIFRRLHPIGEYNGSGIGLAIVKRIIDRHGGRIWVESELGKGSTFYFALPFKNENI